MASVYGGTLEDLLLGPAYIFRADASVATTPTKLDDVFDMETPYGPKTNWSVFGATDGASGGGRGLDEEEIEIEQRTGAVITRITAVTRTLSLPVAEITPENMQIIEAAPDPTTIVEGAAASGTPAQSRLDFGSISGLPRHRLVLVAERDQNLAPGEGGLRGQFVGYALYSATIQAADSDFEVAKGGLVSREIAFRAFPDPDVVDPEKAHGGWIFETGATIP